MTGVTRRARNLAAEFVPSALKIFTIAFTMNLAAGIAQAGTDDFYRGKTLEVLAGSGPGGSYDAYARALSSYIGRHMPGSPAVVTRNVVGAGTFRLATYLEQAAAHDGLAIGNMSSAILTGPLFYEKMASFHPNRLTWIGSAATATYVCLTWGPSKIKTVADLQSTPATFGAIGPSDNRYVHAAILKNFLGAKIKIVSGYPGSNDLRMAIERGEVEGECGDTWESIRSTKPDWVREKKINVLVQFRSGRNPELASVPSIIDFARTDEDRGVLTLLTAAASLAAIPYAAAPDTPPDRTEALRRAFDATMKDPDYIAFARKASLDIDPRKGEEVSAFITKLYKSSPAQLARAKALVQ